MKIAVAGTGYVGLSIACLLSQHNEVKAVDILKEKVDLINAKKSPIQDEYIEKYLAEKDLNLEATLYLLTHLVDLMSIRLVKMVLYKNVIIKEAIVKKFLRLNL